MTPQSQFTPDQQKAALKQAKANVETQKEVADLLAEKIQSREELKVAQAEWDDVEIAQIEAIRAATVKRPEDPWAEDDRLKAARRLKDAKIRVADAEIEHMMFEHEALVAAIEQMEKGIAAVENPNHVVTAAPRVVL